MEGFLFGVAEVVYGDYLVAGFEEFEAGVGADVAGGASDQDGFVHDVLGYCKSVLGCDFVESVGRKQPLTVVVRAPLGATGLSAPEGLLQFIEILYGAGEAFFQLYFGLPV